MPTVNVNSVSGFLVWVSYQLLQFRLWLFSARHKCRKKTVCWITWSWEHRRQTLQDPSNKNSFQLGN